MTYFKLQPALKVVAVAAGFIFTLSSGAATPIVDDADFSGVEEPRAVTDSAPLPMTPGPVDGSQMLPERVVTQQRDPSAMPNDDMPAADDGAAQAPSAAARDTATAADGGPRNSPFSDEERAAGPEKVLRMATPLRDAPRSTAKAVILSGGTRIIVRQKVRNKDGLWWYVSIPGESGWVLNPATQ